MNVPNNLWRTSKYIDAALNNISEKKLVKYLTKCVLFFILLSLLTKVSLVWKCKILLTNKSQSFLGVEFTLRGALCFGSLFSGRLSDGLSVSSGAKMNH